MKYVFEGIFNRKNKKAPAILTEMTPKTSVLPMPHLRGSETSKGYNFPGLFIAYGCLLITLGGVFRVVSPEHLISHAPRPYLFHKLVPAMWNVRMDTDKKYIDPYNHQAAKSNPYVYMSYGFLFINRGSTHRPRGGWMRNGWWWWESVRSGFWEVSETN